MSIHQTRDDAIAQARALASGDDEVVVHDDDGCVVSWYPWSLRMRVA